MKTKLILALLVFTQLVAAQKFNWNPIEKIEDNFNFHYLGDNGKDGFLLLSKFTIKQDFSTYTVIKGISWEKDNVITLVKYNATTFTSVSKTPFQFKNKLAAFYDAFINNDILYFFYSSEVGGKMNFFVDKYDVNQKYLETVLLYEPPAKIDIKKTAIAITDYYTFVKSDNTDFCGLLSIDGSFKLFDKSIKQVWSKSFSYKYLHDIIILNNGSLYLLGSTETKLDLVKYDPNSASPITMNISFAEPIFQNFTLKINEKEKLVYVTSSYSTDGKDKPYYGINIWTTYFRAMGINVNAYDLNTLNLKNKLKIPFAEDVLLTVDMKKKIEKVKGLGNIVFNNLLFTENGGFICIVQEHYTSFSDSNTSSNGASEHYEYIIIISSDKAGSSVQKTIKRNTQGKSQYDYLLSLASFYENNKLIILYNEGSTSYKLIQHEFNLKLDEQPPVTMNTYGEHKIYLSLRNNRKIADNKYLIWGREAKNIGSAILDLK